MRKGGEERERIKKLLEADGLTSVTKPRWALASEGAGPEEGIHWPGWCEASLSDDWIPGWRGDRAWVHMSCSGPHSLLDIN